MKCECEAAGFCTRRKCDVSPVHFNRCKKGQVATMDTLYNFNATNPKAKGTSFNAVGRAQVGTVLTEKISDLLKIKTGGTCGCQNLASKKNRWVQDRCEA